MDAVGFLGLVFAWYVENKSTSLYTNSKYVIWIDMSPMYNWLKVDIVVLPACLLEHDAARVMAPTANEIEGYKENSNNKKVSKNT